MTLSRADAIEPLTIDGGIVRWAGPCDPEPDAPMLRFEARLEEGEEIGDLVARCAMPATLVAALAERFVDVSLDAGDPRWRRALAAARIARGEPVAQVDTPGEVIVDAVVLDVCVEDGIVVAVLRDALWIDGQQLPLPGPAEYLLVRGRVVEPGYIAVATLDRTDLRLIVFDVRRREQVAAVSGVSLTTPLTFSRGARGWWVHGEGAHVCLGPDGTIASRLASHTTWLPDRRFVAWDSTNSVMCCVSLDDEETAEVPCRWLGAIAARDDEVWFTSEQGVFRWDGRGAAIPLATGRMRGIAFDGDRVWVGTATRELLALDLDGREVARLAIKLEADTILVGDTAMLVAQRHGGVFVADRTGAMLAWLGSAGRGPGFATLRDGACVASGSETVSIDREGRVRRVLPLPFDHVVIGATDDRAIIAPTLLWGDHVAYDAAGNLTSQLKTPSGPIPGRPYVTRRKVAITRDHVYATDTRGLLRWDPRGADGIVAPNPRALYRDVQNLGGETGPPGDFGIEDYGSIGIVIRGHDAFAVDCVFGGTTGENPEVPFFVSDGGIAIFLRCDVADGGTGQVLKQASTAILIECSVPANKQWSVGEACHLVLIDCTEVA